MSAPLKRWQVRVAVWQAYRVVVEAASAAEAEAKAERLWTEAGAEDLFSYKDGGFDGAFAEEVGS